MLSDYELGWLVGILEGEAHFIYQGGSQRLTIKMCDEDIINKVATYFERVTGKPVNIRCVAQPKEHWAPVWLIRLTGESARTVMRLIIKHMGTRRRKRVWQSLNRHTPKKVKLDVKALVQNMQANVVSIKGKT